MALAQQDPHLARLMAEIKAAEVTLAARLADLNGYIGQGDHNSLEDHIGAPPDDRGDTAGATEQSKFDDLMETWRASTRTGVRDDTIRHWCETKGIGVKIKGRWWVSISRLEELAPRRRKT